MKCFSLIIVVISLSLFVSCDKEHNRDFVPEHMYTFSYAQSIFVNNEKVCVSGYISSALKYKSKYWIDDGNTDSANFVKFLMPNNIYYTLGTNIAICKNINGFVDKYQFNPNPSAHGEHPFYYKNNEISLMDTSYKGTISSLCVTSGRSYFAGILTVKEYNATFNSTTLRPEPFYWDGISQVTRLSVKGFKYFYEVTCIFRSDNGDFFIGGKAAYPMYWKNSDPVFLSDFQGEVSQIVVSGTDVYAVGFYKKDNFNKTGNTACFWKNGELFELEDNAQASGIYIDGNDVYICGSVGRVPVLYKACYWKNGIRVILPN